MFWERQKRADTRAAPSPNHLTRGSVKMGTNYPSKAGPSTHVFPSNPFPDTPAVRVQPTADTACSSNRSVSTLELASGVLHEDTMGLNEKPYYTHEDWTMDGIVQNAFQNPSYPKVEKGMAGGGKGKGKAAEVGDVFEVPPWSVEVEPAGASLTLTSENYSVLDLNRLHIDFPFLSAPHIQRVLASNQGSYALTRIQLNAEREAVAPSFTSKIAKANISVGKRKPREMEDEAFQRVKGWMLTMGIQVVQEAPDVDELPQSRIPGGAGTSVTNFSVPREGASFECGCCFSPAPFDNMTQCPGGHSFCTECMVAYTSNLLGEHNTKIACMDQSGCKLLFSDSELKRFLTPKLLALYERLKQAKEIEMAGLDGLEECPHCDFKAVIDGPSEGLFRCQNEECRVVTCRKCKKPDHQPKACVEVNGDRETDVRHVVEEAMTNALLRNCPKCKKVFVKESGCNKMTCPNCRTSSCYVCREIVSGYQHFDGKQSGRSQRAGRAGKCPLWDDVEERHEGEVEEARKKAIKEYQKEHPEMGKDMLQAALPEAKGKASGSGRQPRQPRRPARIREFGPYRLPVADRRRDQIQDQEDRLPRPRPVLPRLSSIVASGRNLRKARGALQRRAENARPDREDDWVYLG